MGLSRTVSEINGDFGQIRKSPHRLCIYRPHWGFPLEFRTCGGFQKPRVMPLPDGEEGLCIRLHTCTMPQRDRRTDGQKEMVKQYRALYFAC